MTGAIQSSYVCMILYIFLKSMFYKIKLEYVDSIAKNYKKISRIFPSTLSERNNLDVTMVTFLW